jgi:serine/threonine protein kinase
VTVILSSRNRLGAYEIVAPLGAGGMGEVYRARDTRLGRFVAIKVLPVATDEARLRRFEQEARAAAALNHPGILAVYDIGMHEGTPYIVSELLEGATLRDALLEGPIAPRTAISYGAQIAHALAAAHDKAIVHRDLKPDNIFISREGHVKLLDFGLAKLMQTAPTVETVGFMANVAVSTVPGLVLGTVGYMAPEQVRGEAADHRTDIFAFGVVLYEMVTARRAFGSGHAAEVLTAILREEPPNLASSDGKIPLALERIVRRCFEKVPERRFQSARDLAFALETISSDSSPWHAATFDDTRGRRKWVMIGAALLVVALAAIGIARFRSIDRVGAESRQTIRRMAVVLPTDEPVALASTMPLALGSTSIAISPDGSRLVYVANRNHTTHLRLRELNAFDTVAIADTDGAAAPFFSPDGESLAFFSHNSLKRISIRGGEAVTICEARHARGGAWAADGTIVFAEHEGGQLLRVPSSGGVPTLIASASSPQFGRPAVLPDARTVLFSRTRSIHPDYGRIEAMPIGGGPATVIVENGSQPMYVSSGYLLFLRGGAVYAAPFDLNRRTLSGNPVPVADGIRTESNGEGQIAVADDGTLAYLPGDVAWQGVPVWLRPGGVEESTNLPVQGYSQLRLSPDGRRLAMVVAGPTDSLWIQDFPRSAMTRLTSSQQAMLPVWSPDGKRVFYGTGEGDHMVVVARSADGSGPETRLVVDHAPWAISPDGRWLATVCVRPETRSDICIVEVGKDQTTPTAFVSSPFSEWGAAFSPDGRWLAYTSDASGQNEVYVRPYPTGEGQRQVSTGGGGEEPVWSHDGRELFYRNGTKWIGVKVQTTGEFDAAAPRVLFEGPYLNVPGLSYDVAPDGRFLVIRGPEEGQPTRLNIVLNWFDDLSRRASR